MENVTIWPHFQIAELACKCGCGRADMDPWFMHRLVDLRAEFGRPMVLSSAYRCPEHNTSVSKTGRTGPHTTGRAVDVRAFGQDALFLIDAAVRYGFTGIGVKQHGPHRERFVHLDDLSEAPGQPRPHIWSYA